MKPIYKTITKWVILCALFFYTGWITVWAHNQADKEVCTGIRIEVEGDTPMRKVVEKGVRAELNDYPKEIVGTPIRNLGTEKIRKYLAQMSNFESVNVMITADRELLVKVVPMIPVMRVFTGNTSYYINREGKHIEAKPEFYTDVPVVKGNFSKKFTPREMVGLVQFIRNDEFLSNFVSMIEVPNRNNIILIPRVFGHVVNFGDTTDLRTKTDNLKLFYRKVIPHKGWNMYDTISVKFRDQIVATRKVKNLPVELKDETDEIDPEDAALQELTANSPTSGD